MCNYKLTDLDKIYGLKYVFTCRKCGEIYKTSDKYSYDFKLCIGCHHQLYNLVPTKEQDEMPF